MNRLEMTTKTDIRLKEAIEVWVAYCISTPRKAPCVWQSLLLLELPFKICVQPERLD